MPAIILVVLWLAAVLYTIRDIFERTDLERNTQLLWTILVLIAPFLGMVIYYVAEDEKRRGRK